MWLCEVEDGVAYPEFAMLKRPGCVCLKLKFSSSKESPPKMLMLPVPSPFMKSPPWIMKLGIYAEISQVHP
jgi:hypothetical protein